MMSAEVGGSCSFVIRRGMGDVGCGALARSQRAESDAGVEVHPFILGRLNLILSLCSLELVGPEEEFGLEATDLGTLR